MKILQKLDSSRFILEVESLTILLIETSLFFLILCIPLDEAFLSYLFLDKFPPFYVVSFEVCSTTETNRSMDIIGVDSSSREFIDNLVELLQDLSSCRRPLAFESMHSTSR